MTILTISCDVMDHYDDDDMMVCVFCDESTALPYCAGCQEYKGLMTIADWESYTGEVWE